MTRQRQDRVLEMLVRDGGWRTAAELADRLGVTSRSVRSYVAAVNERVGGEPTIESGPLGYRVRADRAAGFTHVRDDDSPDARRHAIARELLLTSATCDLYDLATRHHVSDATVEADLGWVRSRAAEHELTWHRDGTVVSLSGTERARRALLRTLLHADSATGYDERSTADLVGHDAVDRVRHLRSRLSSRLAAEGFYVNEFALAAVAVQAVLGLWRAASGHVVEHAPHGALVQSLHPIVAEVVAEFDAAPAPPTETLEIAASLRSRGAIAAPDTLAENPADEDIARELREIVDRVTQRFAVAPLEDDVLGRLVAHVQNLRRRTSGGEWSRNPLTRTLKTSYPLLFDVAVSLATALYERFGIPVHDDEVAYLAMHIGGQWERRKALENRLTATLVCPGYYEMHELLRDGIEQSLGSVLTITEVRTGLDPAPGATATDLVLTTIERDTAADTVVQISPFFTDVDAERVMAAVARIRRSRRLAHLREELGRYFVPSAFVTGLDATSDEETVIRRLGALLIAEGIIDESYVDSAVQRERVSSTAFTETLAVPHAMGMTATRTAIAVGIAHSTVPWGEARVQVVAFVAFSESDREAFQTVFEQFVEVFSDPAVAGRLVRTASDFDAFLGQLAAVIED